jgi:hypothetical protein
MRMMNAPAMLQYISIALELAITFLALRLVFLKKRYVGVGLAVTFGIYVFYDLAKTLNWGLPRPFLDDIFFIATLSALLTVLYLGSRRG